MSSTEWPMQYAVTVVFEARGSEHALDVLGACSEIAAEVGGGFLGGWGNPFAAETEKSGNPITDGSDVGTSVSKPHRSEERVAADQHPPTAQATSPPEQEPT